MDQLANLDQVIMVTLNGESWSTPMAAVAQRPAVVVHFSGERLLALEFMIVRNQRENFTIRLRICHKCGKDTRWHMRLYPRIKKYWKEYQTNA